jgi:hypothetical protein
MVLLAAKNYISYLQIWADPVKEKIRTKVYDAFDIYVKGDLTDIYDSPMIVKAIPMLISEIKANEYFDEEALEKISPDNRLANSEVKQAYLQAKYSFGQQSDQVATLIEKEAYIKEYLNDENWAQASKDSEDTGVLEGKSKGDLVIRQLFVAGGTSLYDKYVNLPEYPFVDLRLEPGQIYGTSLIERFIPANKSLDMVVSRLERYTHTQAVGTWLKRKGESFEITNQAGGQVLEYETTKPEQGQMAPMPNYVFNYMNFLEKLIDEQGASTSALGQLPAGIRSGTAIESLKATEYANLKIPSMKLQQTVKRIAQRMLDIADRHYVTAQDKIILEQGEASYFTVMGNRAIEAKKKLKVNVPSDVVPLKKDLAVEIEVQQGMGFTDEGKKAAMKDIITFMQALVQNQMMPPDALAIIVKKFLELYEFGSTAEIFDAFQNMENPNEMTPQALDQMKLAVAEVLRDTGVAGGDQQEQQIQTTKIGVAEALNDLKGGGGNANG